MSKRKTPPPVVAGATTTRKSSIGKLLCQRADEFHRRALVEEIVEECIKVAKEGGYGRNFYPRCFCAARAAVFHKNVSQTLADLAEMQLTATFQANAATCSELECKECSHYCIAVEWRDVAD